jgi:hypothetical protein
VGPPFGSVVYQFVGTQVPFLIVAAVIAVVIGKRKRKNMK